VLIINLVDRAYSFVIFLLLARNFPSVDYGQIITIFSLATIFSTIFDLGFPAYLQREIAVEKQNASHIFTNVFISYLLIFLPYSGTVLLIYFLFYKTIAIYLLIVICVSMYLSSLVNICNKALSGMMDFKSQLKSFLISRIFIVIFFTTGLYYFQFDPVSLLTVILIGFFLHIILMFWYLDKNHINLEIKKFDIKYVLFVLRNTAPLGIAIIMTYLYDKIDVLLISKLLDYSKVAVYNIGYGVYKSSSLAFSFILVSGFTRVSFLSRNRNGVYLFLKKYSAIIGFICFVSALFLILLSKPIIRIIYTDKYIDSINILKILSVGIIAMGLNNLTGIILNGIGMYKTVMYITLFGLIINVALNIAFIPLYGLLAATIITVITEYFIFIFEFYYLYRILNIKQKQITSIGNI
jgi:O-antigen/teichoic acid export membrane protein